MVVGYGVPIWGFNLEIDFKRLEVLFDNKIRPALNANNYNTYNNLQCKATPIHPEKQELLNKKSLKKI